MENQGARMRVDDPTLAAAATALRDFRESGDLDGYKKLNALERAISAIVSYLASMRLQASFEGYGKAQVDPAPSTPYRERPEEPFMRSLVMKQPAWTIVSGHVGIPDNDMKFLEYRFVSVQAATPADAWMQFLWLAYKEVKRATGLPAPTPEAQRKGG